nr:uncharacterized protein LOC115256996 [Aedes albopictus]
MDQLEYITLNGPLLPTVAAPINDEQKHYNPMFDDEALEVDFEVLLDRAGLTVYSSIIIDTHGITTAEEFSELQENDLDLFCRIARDRVMFRKLLANMKTLFNPEPAAVLKTETVNQLVETQSPQTPKTFKNFQEYLSSRPEGKGILAYYQEHKTLTNTLRNNMVKMIFTDAVAEGITLNSKFNEIMTKKITDLFTTENTETYYKNGYTTSGGRVGSSGKFIKRKGIVLESLGMKKTKKTGSVRNSEADDQAVEGKQNHLLY